MKLLLPSTLLLLGISLSAQMPGMMSMQAATADGTSLGANETLAYNGIALGNRVKMRGYVDFIFGYDDEDDVAGGDPEEQNEQFNTASDLDFLFDLSPITAEVHVAMDPGAIDLEQAFGRYDIGTGFNVSFGRQLTSLGFEADEAPGLYAVTNAYRLGGVAGDDAIGLSPAQTRRNYKDGVRMNFNNGQFGVILGLHDGYWGNNDDFNGDNLAIDIAASVMIVPGLEARLGYAQQEIDPDSDISQFNAWIAYNPNDLTLAFEYDNFDIDAFDDEYWSMMLLANYQFTDWFAGTIRYSHEDYEDGADHEADTFTFAMLFTLTSNFFLNVEYSTTDVDSNTQGDYNEFFVEGLITY